VSVGGVPVYDFPTVEECIRSNVDELIDMLKVRVTFLSSEAKQKK